MKVIYLLNMIAKGEKVPKKIRIITSYAREYFEYDTEQKEYINVLNKRLGESWNLDGILNEEVEIIDEKVFNSEDDIIFKGEGDIEFLEWFINSKHTEIYEDYYQQVDNSIKNLIYRIKELEEINEEHQKLNGELQDKLIRLEIKNKVITEVIEGKTVRELGTSDLYKED